MELQRSIYAGQNFQKKFPKLFAQALRDYREIADSRIARKHLRTKSEELFQYLKNADSTQENQLRTWCFFNRQMPLPCRTCGVPIERFNNRVREPSEYCSVECAGKSPDRTEKARATNLDKYGVDNPSKSKKVLKKIRQTLVERTGYAHALQNPDSRKRFKTTCQERYGVDHSSQNETIKEKQRATCQTRYGVDSTLATPKVRKALIKSMQQKYGVDFPMQSDKILAKRKATIQERYGVDHPLQSQEVIDRREQNSFRKHGVRHPMQLAEVFQRVVKAAYRRKKVEIKGNIFKVQGHEDVVLETLIPNIREIVTSPKSMPKLIYEYKDKDHRYYPDAKFVSTKGNDILLEVKSLGTLRMGLDRNLAKFKVAYNWCKKNDHLFVLAVSTKDKVTNWIYFHDYREAKKQILGLLTWKYATL